MSQGGVGVGGASGPGPSTAYDALPYTGYKDAGAWVEEFVDALGLEFDIRYQKFISAQARANLLDPTYTPTDVATQFLATATAAPLGATSKDTMLDVLLFVALGIYPADSNLTVQQKQQLVQVGWNALRRKGNRSYLLALAAILGDGIAVGWTVPPYNFSVIFPDGAPAPGWGAWVQPTGATAETSRPWILNAARGVLSTTAPTAFVNLGVGYTQARAGYSSAGETVFPIGSRLCILQNEHFSTWSTGVPTGWTKTGAATLTQSTSTSLQINWEYTGSAAQLDLTAATIGQAVGLRQAASSINNLLTHRVHLDYSYTNTQSVSVLTMQVTDVNRDGNTYYWNNATGAWQTSAFSIAVPPSATRARFAFDIVPRTTGATGTAFGTTGLTIAVSATYDGTATTAVKYTLYRVGLYEKFSLTVEQAASGERTLWLPLVDSPGWSTAARASGTGVLLETAAVDRTSYRLTPTTTSASFPSHPALNGHGFRAHGAWTNLLKGSNDFGADWSLVNASKVSNANVSPAIGDGGTAPTLTATSISVAPVLQQGIAVVPNNRSYVGGVWVKKLSSDSAFTDVTLIIGATSTFSQTFALKQSQGWQLLPLQCTFGGSEVGTLVFKVTWDAGLATNGQIAVADAYLYEVTGNPAVLYPPVVRSSIGSTGTLGATTCQAVSASQGVNVLSPLLQRTMASVVRGGLALEVVPTFDASSQPNGVIFDVAQAAAQNRVVLRVAGGALELRRWDASGNQWAATLTMTTNATPPAGSVFWKRDTAIVVRCLWDAQTTMLGAGSATASGAKPGSWAPADASVAAVGAGNDWNNANPFEGWVTLVEALQLGAPTT
jgi:hypothetical protein